MNSKKQFLDSPDLHDAVIVAVLGNQTSHNKMADSFTSTGEVEFLYHRESRRIGEAAALLVRGNAPVPPTSPGEPSLAR